MAEKSEEKEGKKRQKVILFIYYEAITIRPTDSIGS